MISKCYPAGALVIVSVFTGVVVSQETQVVGYDPGPFLASMVQLRAAAITCDPFVAGNPATRTEPIPTFFKSLKQDLPDLADTETQSSLNRFVRSQAAILCRDKLAAAFLLYGNQAAIYGASKPKDWPDAPPITPSAWCSTENCLEF